MMFETMMDEEKEYANEERQRKSSESMSSESSGRDSDYCSVADTDTDKTPLIKITYCDAEELEWDMQTGKLKEYSNECAMY